MASYILPSITFFPDFDNTAAMSCSHYPIWLSSFLSLIVPAFIIFLLHIIWFIKTGRLPFDAYLSNNWAGYTYHIKKIEEKKVLNCEQCSNCKCCLKLGDGLKIKCSYETPASKEEMFCFCGRRLRAIRTGLFYLMLPFLVQTLFRWLFCPKNQLSGSCPPQSFSHIVILLVVILVIFQQGTLFLVSPSKSQDGSSFMFTKTKKSHQKKWDFVVYFRVFSMSLLSFVSNNGVFQAGLGVTVILSTLVFHQWAQPYKNPK